MQPTRYRHLVATGLARAMLAGAPERAGVLARTCEALGGVQPLPDALVDELLPVPRERWHAMQPGELARRITATDAFPELLSKHEAPYVRRWILRPSAMSTPPLGLDGLDLPQLDHVAGLAQWLGLDVDTLGAYTYCSERRRRVPLHAQHYGFRLQPKRSGGGRLVEAPRRRLKALQRRVLGGLLARVPVHEACHGFVAGRSVRSHAQRHTGQDVVLQFDLQDFFGSIGVARVESIFRTLGFPPGVAAELAALCTVSTPDPVLQRLRDDGWIDWRQAKRLAAPHLPQGAPTSPALANLSGFNLDLRLDGLAHALGARYSRYADDLVLSGPRELAGNADRIGAWVAHIAHEEGYRLNHRKTRLATQAAQQRVCGVVVNRHANLPRAEFDLLRAELHRCAVRGPSPDEGDPVAYRARLLGRVQWAAQLNPAKAHRLHRLWSRIAW
jgi:RNA-directed DNA polymerase